MDGHVFYVYGHSYRSVWIAKKQLAIHKNHNYNLASKSYRNDDTCINGLGELDRSRVTFHFQNFGAVMLTHSFNKVNTFNTLKNDTPHTQITEPQPKPNNLSY